MCDSRLLIYVLVLGLATGRGGLERGNIEDTSLGMRSPPPTVTALRCAMYLRGRYARRKFDIEGRSLRKLEVDRCH